MDGDFFDRLPNLELVLQTGGHAYPRQRRPGHVQSGQVRQVAGGDEENRAQADAQTRTDATDEQRLQQDHPQDAAVGDAHRLEGTEMLEILQDEQVQRLTRDGGPHAEAQGDRDTEVHREPCRL